MTEIAIIAALALSALAAGWAALFKATRDGRREERTKQRAEDAEDYINRTEAGRDAADDERRAGGGTADVVQRMRERDGDWTS